MKRMTAGIAILMMASAIAGCQTVTGRTASEHIKDKWILSETKGRLVAARFRNLTAVDVDVNRGIVYLTGTVATTEQKVRAEEIARDADGVRDVVNNLQVANESSARAATAPSASPAGSVGVHHHTVTGRVASVNRATGHLTLRSPDGDVVLQIPPAALQDVKEGDRLTVRLALSPTR